MPVRVRSASGKIRAASTCPSRSSMPTAADSSGSSARTLRTAPRRTAARHAAGQQGRHLLHRTRTFDHHSNPPGALTRPVTAGARWLVVTAAGSASRISLTGWPCARRRCGLLAGGDPFRSGGADLEGRFPRTVVDEGGRRCSGSGRTSAGMPCQPPAGRRGRPRRTSRRMPATRTRLSRAGHDRATRTMPPVRPLVERTDSGRRRPTIQRWSGSRSEPSRRRW